MRRAFTMSTCALVLALVPAAVFAQTPPAQQTPAAPAAQPPAQPKAELTFTGDAGILLVQIKPDQTAAFEEGMAKLKATLEKAEDATLKQLAGGITVYKSAEGMQGNALYVLLLDPAAKGTDYSFFALFQKAMTPDELRLPETQELFKKFAAAFVGTGLNKLNLTVVSRGTAAK